MAIDKNYHYIYRSGRAVPDVELLDSQISSLRTERDSAISSKSSHTLIVRECFKCEPRTAKARHIIESAHDTHCFQCGRVFFRGNDITDYSTFIPPVEVELSNTEDQTKLEHALLKEFTKQVQSESPEGSYVEISDSSDVEKDGITLLGFIVVSALMLGMTSAMYFALNYAGLLPL